MRNTSIDNIDYEILENMLLKSLTERYPDEQVATGENWNLLAKIFYDIGYDQALLDQNKETK